MSDPIADAYDSAEDEPEPPEARLAGYERRRARALVLPEHVVTGTPEGTGTTTVMPGEAQVREIPIWQKRAPAADVSPQSPDVEPSQIMRASVAAALGDPNAREWLAQGSRLGRGGPGAAPVAGMRMRTDPVETTPLAARAEREATDLAIGSSEGTSGTYHGDTAGVTGLVQGATLGFADEARGLARGGLEGYRRERDLARAEQHAAEEQAPGLYGLGHAAGSLVPGVALPVGGGATAAARIGQAAGVGGVLGAASGLGESEAEGPDALYDAATGAALGAAAGGAIGGAIEAPGALARRLQAGIPRAARARDEALLAATTSAGRGRTAIRAFERPGATSSQAVTDRARAAGVLRETGAVPRVGTAGQVGARIDAARDAATATMDSIRSRMTGAGIEGRTVADRLRARAAEDTTAFGGPYRDSLLQRAQQIEETYGRRPITYERLMAEMEALRRSGTVGGAQTADDAARTEINRVVREAYDDAVEAVLGPEARAAYRTARQRFATLETAARQAREGEAAAAGNRATGFSEQIGGMLGGSGVGGAVGAALGGTAGAGIGGPAGAAIGALGMRALRATEPTLRATAAAARFRGRVATAEWLTRLVRETPDALGPYASRFRAALERSNPLDAISATHYLLSQTDPDYRALIERTREGEE